MVRIDTKRTTYGAEGATDGMVGTIYGAVGATYGTRLFCLINCSFLACKLRKAIKERKNLIVNIIIPQLNAAGFGPGLPSLLTCSAALLVTVEVSR
jgi:hypothetical protein